MASISYKCPGCGGPLKWNAAKEKYSCEYCGSEFAESELEDRQVLTEETQKLSEEEAKYAGAEGKADAKGKIAVYHCPSCGAQIVTEDTTAALSCYYCHTPVVLEDRLEGGFAPDKVIPFAVDKKRALEIFKDWISKHKYVPSEFYSESQIQLFNGVYFPYWIYSAKVRGRVQGTGEKDRVWTSGGEQFTETSSFRIDRSGEMPVNNLSRIALSKASRVLCESVAPFDYEKMRPFNTGYLSGFMAEAKDIAKETVESEVRDEVKTYAQSCLSGEAGGEYTRVQLENVSTQVTDEKWEYVLMPVWTMTYRADGGKLYYFSVNGSTGKTIGELPIDKKKLITLFFKIFIPVFAVLMILLYFIA